MHRNLAKYPLRVGKSWPIVPTADQTSFLTNQDPHASRAIAGTQTRIELFTTSLRRLWEPLLGSVMLDRGTGSRGVHSQAQKAGATLGIRNQSITPKWVASFSASQAGR
ncbi:hypothetical protein ACXR0O_27500 [Verrucomicrobiota bacterium sgz303538]